LTLGSTTSSFGNWTQRKRMSDNVRRRKFIDNYTIS